VEAEKAYFPVRVLCQVLQVSVSGFYSWRKRGPSQRAREDEQLKVHIRAAHKASRGRYGSPRVQKDLCAQDQHVGRKRVARLMKADGLAARRKRRFRRTTDSTHQHPVAPNLLDRQFTVDAPNAVWVTDITYIWTQEGWLYLAAILDLYSRKVVGWAVDESLERHLALDALAMALSNRRPARGLLHHSDRGVQYASDDYQKALKKDGLICSMSRKGDCWDNAVAESFFATLKAELVYLTEYRTRAEARASLFEYIEVFYNRQRRHSAIGYVSPSQFEIAAFKRKMAA
jgi:transposase InsO family protein